MSARLVLIGRVAGAFGVKGEVRIAGYGEDVGAMLRYRTLMHQDGRPALTLLSGRLAKGELIAKTQEVTVKEAADALRGLELYVPRAALPKLEEDEFYLTDLVGLRAETLAGEVLGTIKAVQNFGAGDLLEVASTKGGAFYLPFTREAVPHVEIEAGRIVATPPTEVEEHEP